MNTRLLAAAVAVALPTFASAQEVSLAPIVVTASRTAQTVDEALAPVAVITREDIERRQAQSVSDLLRGQPGVSISSNGGLGKQTSVFLRGTNSSHVLVLVDGIKAGSATAGGFAWQDIPPDQIKRIEIVRGPRSSLYGSEAIGGVIQIFTRKGSTGFTPSASVGIGNDGTHQTTANLTGGSARGWFNIGASHLETDGYDACRNITTGGCFVDEPDDDGYRRTAVSARAGLRFSRAEAELSLLQSKGHNEYDGDAAFDAPNQSDVLQRVIGGQASLEVTDRWNSRLVAGRSWDESDDFHDGTFLGYFDTKRDTVSWLNDLTVSDRHMVSLGADYQRDQVESTIAYDRTSRDNVGVFARYFGEFGGHDVELAARQDDNEQFGDHTTGSIAWGYQIAPELRLLASYGTAFKAPTFNQLYWPADAFFAGNPDLAPERSRTIDLGLQGILQSARWSVHAFQTNIEDMIASAPAPLYLQNIDEARIRGLELAMATRLLGWDASAAVTLLDPIDHGSANRGNLLPHRARRAGRIDLDRSFGVFSLGGSIAAESRRYDDAANTQEMGGYAVVDLRASYAVGKRWRVQGKIGNVFDKDYETAAFFNRPGRTWFVSLHYVPAGR